MKPYFKKIYYFNYILKIEKAYEELLNKKDILKIGLED